MHADFRLLTGIVLAHALWALAYATGTLLDAKTPLPQTRSQALLDFVVRSATGIALWAFAAFALALAGWLNAGAFACLLMLLVATGRVQHGPVFFTARFWRDRTASVGLAFGGANVVLYYVALVTIVPAALPDAESDSVRYHLAYAMEWAHEGGLTIDRFLRQPLYANNFLMVFAALDVLRLENYVHFVTWLCGALAMLAVRAGLRVIDDACTPATSGLERFSRSAVTFTVPLSIVVTPVFLRWVDTGMVDIPIELYVFILPLCAVGALLLKRDLRWSAMCCGAFAIGMKISLIAFIPLFAVLAWLLVRALGETRRAAGIACTVMILAASPWYVRNVVYDADPIPPVVNLMRNRPDLTYSPEDARNVLRDITPDRSPPALLALPWRMWADPQNLSLREHGSTALSLFLYVPLAVVAIALAFGARRPAANAVILLSATTVYALAYCLMTSYFLRYLLIVEPPLAASFGAILLRLPGRALVAVARTAIAVVSVVPSPSALGYYQFTWNVNYLHFEARDSSDERYLVQTLNGYTQTERLLATPLFRRKPFPRVLLVGTETEYYFRVAGVRTVGDWFGPGRFADLATALDNDRLGDYIRYFDIGGVIFRRGGQIFFNSRQYVNLVRGLHQFGFEVLEDDPNGFLVAVRSKTP